MSNNTDTLWKIKSRQTQLKQYEERLEKYQKNPNHCTQCNDDLSYEQRRNKFCSSSCSASYNNIGVVRYGKLVNGIRLNARKLFMCGYCGNLTPNKKFCDSSCQRKLQWSDTVQDAKENGVFKTNHAAKRYLLERSKHCSICGIDTWLDQPVLLILDHIDGNSSNMDIENFRLICSNCDSTLSTYKARNKGNGRYARRKRYEEGKSY